MIRSIRESSRPNVFRTGDAGALREIGKLAAGCYSKRMEADEYE